MHFVCLLDCIIANSIFTSQSYMELHSVRASLFKLGTSRPFLTSFNRVTASGTQSGGKVAVYLTAL